MTRPGVPLLVVAAITIAYVASLVHAEVEEQVDLTGSQSYSNSWLRYGWPLFYVERFEQDDVLTGEIDEARDTWSIRNIFIDVGVVLLLTASLGRCAIPVVRLCRDRFKFSIIGLLMVTASIAAAFALTKLLQHEWPIDKYEPFGEGVNYGALMRDWTRAYIGSFCFAYCGLEVFAWGLRYLGSRRTG